MRYINIYLLLLLYTMDVESICWGPNPHLLGLGCLNRETNPSSLFYQRRELLYHVGDLLTQQNYIISKF